MKDKFLGIPIEEQETILLFDYEKEKMTVYSNKPSIIKRLKDLQFEGKIGIINNKIFSYELTIPFSDENVTKVLSVKTLIGAYYRQKGKEHAILT